MGETCCGCCPNSGYQGIEMTGGEDNNKFEGGSGGGNQRLPTSGGANTGTHSNLTITDPKL